MRQSYRHEVSAFCFLSRFSTTFLLKQVNDVVLSKAKRMRVRLYRSHRLSVYLGLLVLSVFADEFRVYKNWESKSTIFYGLSVELPSNKGVGILEIMYFYWPLWKQIVSLTPYAPFSSILESSETKLGTLKPYWYQCKLVTELNNRFFYILYTIFFRERIAKK